MILEELDYAVAYDAGQNDFLSVHERGNSRRSGRCGIASVSPIWRAICNPRSVHFRP